MNSTISKVMLALALFLGLSNALLSTQSSGTTVKQNSVQMNSTSGGAQTIQDPPPCSPNKLC